MPYDERLADRFRAALGRTHHVTEKKMMGGLCFLVKGHMIGAVDRSKKGEPRFMFRVGKENEAEALARPGASRMRQGRRHMYGFVVVNEQDCNQAALEEWIGLAKSFVQGLPPKT